MIFFRSSETELASVHQEFHGWQKSIAQARNATSRLWRDNVKWLDRLLGNSGTAINTDKQDSSHASRDESRPTPVKGMFVCSATYRDKAGLYLLDSDGKVAEELTSPAPGERLGDFDVSPDARWVVYTRYMPRRQDRDPYPTICAVPAVGGNTNEVESRHPDYETCYQNPAFSPTGEKIVCEFGLNNFYNPDLTVLKLFESGDRLHGWSTGLSIINPLRIGNHAPQFMPDGERIVYFSNFAYEDLLEVCLYDPKIADDELLGVVGWRLTENADGVWRRPRAIAVQSEWEQIFFIQGHMRSAERICMFLLSDLSPGSLMKQFDSVGGEHSRIGALEMSSDGLLLAYDADDAIYVVGADGGAVRRISPEGVNCRGPQFSEDGNRIAYIGDDKLRIAGTDGSILAILTGEELRIDKFIWT